MEQVGQSDRLLAQVNATSRTLGDREVALRRYLASGSPEILAAYREANTRLGSSFDDLAKLTSDNPDQSSRLARLRKKCEIWDRSAGEEIKDRVGPSGRNRPPQKADGSKEQMDEIRESLTAFLAAEEGGRDRRSEATQSLSWTILATCSGVGISLAALLAHASRRNLGKLCHTFETALDDLESRTSLQELENLSLLSEVMKYYAIFSLDSDGRITSWNADAERILGYRAEDVLDRRPSCFYSPEDLRRDVLFRDLEWAALEGRLEDERWLIRKDGFRFKARVALVAIRDASGVLTGYTDVIHEIEDQGSHPRVGEPSLSAQGATFERQAANGHAT